MLKKAKDFLSKLTFGQLEKSILLNTEKQHLKQSLQYLETLNEIKKAILKERQTGAQIRMNIDAILRKNKFSTEFEVNSLVYIFGFFEPEKLKLFQSESKEGNEVLGKICVYIDELNKELAQS